MSKTRALVIGASGQVGLALSSALKGVWDLVETAHNHAVAPQVPLDLGDQSAVESLLASVQPDVVLIAGAMCNVDGCELEPEVCWRINVNGPAVVAAYLSRHGGTAVFFSTDHVFDGTKVSYQESDTVHPLSVYARSKVDAEDAVRQSLPTRHLILRTGWVYGPDPNRRNFILRLVDRVRSGQTVTVPSDQWGSPTLTDDLARTTRALLDRGMTGTFHATGPDYLNRATMAGMVCEIFGLDRHQIRSVPTEQLGQAAVRSRRVRLDCAKLHAADNGAFKSVAEGLAFMADWNARPIGPIGPVMPVGGNRDRQ